MPVFYKIEKYTTDKIFTTPLYSNTSVLYSTSVSVDETRTMHGEPIDMEVVKCNSGKCTEFTSQCEVCVKNARQNVTPGKKSFNYTAANGNLVCKKRVNSKESSVFYKILLNTFHFK